VRAHQVNQQEREVEKLEGRLHEREELDDITLRHELEALSTCETVSLSGSGKLWRTPVPRSWPVSST
jgi:predicted RNase H-like nuclease (RuvC/YqgF family)